MIRVPISYFGKYDYEIDYWLDKNMPNGGWSMLRETVVPTLEQIVTVNFVNEKDALWFAMRWL